MRQVVGDAVGVAGQPVAEKVADDATPSESKPAVWPQFLASCVVNLNTFAFGASMSWPAMALPQLMQPRGPLSPDEASWVSSLLPLAAFAATPLYCALTQRLSRRWFGYLTILPLLIAWPLKIASTSTTVLYVARVLAGVHAAGTLVLPPMYVAEVASDEVRGALGCLLGLISNSGVLFAYAAGAYLPYDVVLYASFAPALLFVVVFPFMPETPYWLVRSRQHSRARQTLRWLRRGATDRQVEREVARIEASLGRADGNVDTDVGGSRACSRAALLGVALVGVVSLNQQLCGSFAVINYAVLIFREAGSSLSPELATILLGALQVVGGVLSTPLMDRLGRRPILFISNFFVGLSVAALGVFFYLKSETDVDVSSIGWLPVTCLSVDLLMAAVGLGPLPYVLLSELVVARLRGLASLVAFTSIWGAAALMTKLYPLMSEAMGVYGTFWLFAAVCILGTIIVMLALPETKERPLEDIIQDLSGSKKPDTEDSY